MTMSPAAPAPGPKAANADVAIAVALATLKPAPQCQCFNCSCERCECNGGVCKCEACASAVAKTPTLGAEWTDYTTAREKAFREHRCMVVLVCSDNCPPCRELEKTLCRSDVAIALTSFACAKVHAESDPKLVADLGVTRFPSLVFSRPGPELIYWGTREGIQSPEQIKADAKSADAVPVEVRVPQATQFRPVLQGPVMRVVSGGC